MKINANANVHTVGTRHLGGFLKENYTYQVFQLLSASQDLIDRNIVYIITGKKLEHVGYAFLHVRI